MVTPASSSDSRGASVALPVGNLVLARAFAVMVAVVGSVVMLAWKFDWRLILQITPNYVPMQFNTAAGFALAGVTMMIMLNGWSKTAALGGIACVAIGGLTIFEYVSGGLLGFDQFFQVDFLAAGISAHPGRMAPNAAACFLLFGLCVTALANIRDPWRGHFVVGAVSVTICALGLVYAIGYYTGVAEAYDLRDLGRMSLLAAICFVLLGAAMAMLVWSNPFQEFRIGRLVLPTVVGLAGLVGTFVLWNSLVEDQKERIVADIQRQVATTRTDARLLLDGRAREFENFGARLVLFGRQEARDWQDEARRFLDSTPGGLTVVWADPAGARHWHTRPESIEVTAAIERVLTADARERAQPGSTRARASLIRVAADERVLLLVDRSAAREGGDLLVAAIDLKTLARAVFAGTAEGYSFRVTVAGQEVAGRYEKGRNFEEQWSESATVEFAGLDWSISLWPGRRLLAEKYSSRPDITLLVGVILSLMFPLALQDTYRMRKLAQQSQAHADKLERLLPLCGYCKKIRRADEDPLDQDSWLEVDHYLAEEERRKITHTICPHCMEAQLGIVPEADKM